MITPAYAADFRPFLQDAFGVWGGGSSPTVKWKAVEPRNGHYAFDEQFGEQLKDRPHHSEIIAARDRVIARHPQLRVVGAHLGSLEYDVDELAQRFDRYPNFAADTSGTGRIGDLSHQDRNKVRAFFLRYQDRLMFGTDRSTTGQMKMTARDLGRSLGLMREAVQTAWDFYATDQTVKVNGRPCAGLALPEAVLRKLFAENARKWYAGL